MMTQNGRVTSIMMFSPIKKRPTNVLKNLKNLKNKAAIM
jgi:hypothetical protein